MLDQLKQFNSLSVMTFLHTEFLILRFCCAFWCYYALSNNVLSEFYSFSFQRKQGWGRMCGRSKENGSQSYEQEAASGYTHKNSRFLPQ